MGTSKGEILESLDGGQTWRLLTNFGEHCPIEQVRAMGGRFYATVRSTHGVFSLSSKHGRLWRTPPRA